MQALLIITWLGIKISSIVSSYPSKGKKDAVYIPEVKLYVTVNLQTILFYVMWSS